MEMQELDDVEVLRSRKARGPGGCVQIRLTTGRSRDGWGAGSCVAKPDGSESPHSLAEKKLRSQLKLGHILHAFFLDYFTFLPSFLCWLLSCPSPNTAGLSSVLSWDGGLLHRAPSREVGSFPLPSLTSLLNPGSFVFWLELKS